MVTIISGSNRKGSECYLFARTIKEIMSSKTDEEVQLLSLEKIPHDWFFSKMYDKGSQAESITKVQDEYMIPADKFFFILPEYNGSMPGSLKMFLDALSVRNIKETFKNKKAAVMGVASGRAGNLLGLDHLVAVLNHLGVITHPKRLPVSKIHSLIQDDKVTDEKTLETMEGHVDAFLAF
ncbi:MAG: NAD(P)H-dependent oxidoreductase [Bacteroidota bacterium]